MEKFIMRHFSEDFDHIGAECEKCGRILKIAKTSCSTIDNGFNVNPPVKCICGNVSDLIYLESKKSVKSHKNEIEMLNLPFKQRDDNRMPYFIVAAVIIAWLFFVIFGIEHKKDAPLDKSVVESAQQTEEREKNNFITNIDDKYKQLVDYYKNKNRDSSILVIADFKKYGKMDYKDVKIIEKKLSEPKYIKAVEKELAEANRRFRQKEREQMAEHRESCYQLGFRYGRCGTMALKGYQCDPSDDIIVPVECRGRADTDRGTRDGVASVW